MMNVNATGAVIGRCACSILDDVTGNLFSLCFFFSTWRAVLKMFVRLFRIKQVKAS